ncbi:MAG: endonuclease domain-containing protein [Gammaproteobacteria bacterium]
MDVLKYKSDLKPFARELRKKQTPAEQLLWHYLRKKQVLNTRFSRQNPIGPYIVDFFAKEVKLVIEVDGSQHYDLEHLKYDQDRDQYLRSLGLRILRFNNLSVLKNTETVMNIIELTIQGKSVKNTHSKYVDLW